jgi:hypothetical protein
MKGSLPYPVLVDSNNYDSEPTYCAMDDKSLVGVSPNEVIIPGLCTWGFKLAQNSTSGVLELARYQRRWCLSR